MQRLFETGDYYPFGMLMPGRSTASGSYRYGFNGKEQDPEVSGDGNQYDYGFRIYNPRLGRFLSVDPMTESYPWNSPYSYAEGDPVNFIDLDGLEKASPKGTLTQPVIRNVSESTCQGCPARAQALAMAKATADLDKLRSEYKDWQSKPENFLKPVPPQYVKVAPTATPSPAFNQGGVLGSKEYMLAKANYETYGKYLPGLSDLDDGINLANALKEGNYKTAAMFGLFLLPGGDFAKPAKGFLTKLAADGAEFALKNTGRLQHAFKHAKDIRQFAGKSWNNEVKEAWRSFNSDILQTATKSFDNVLGKDRVKGFYKNVDGQDIATYVYKDGDKAGEIATTVVLTENQMTKFGLK